jgi:plasmid stability protein
VATLTIRALDDDLKQALRVRAAQHGRSMEAEVRAILEQVLRTDPVPEYGLGTWIHQRFAALGGVELELPSRAADRPLVDFGP